MLTLLLLLSLPIEIRCVPWFDGGVVCRVGPDGTGAIVYVPRKEILKFGPARPETIEILPAPRTPPLNLIASIDPLSLSHFYDNDPFPPCILGADRKLGALCNDLESRFPSTKKPTYKENRGTLIALILVSEAADLHSSGWMRRHGLREINPAVQTTEEHIALKTIVAVAYVALIPKTMQSPNKVNRVLGRVVKWGLPALFFGAAVNNYGKGSK